MKSNKEKVVALQNSIESGDPSALSILDATRYKQHNVHVGDGLAPIMELHRLMPQHEVYVNVVRAFQDGDYSFVHVDYHLFEPTVAFDVHRFEGGVSVEHWDNLQPTPHARNKAGRTMTNGKTQVRDHQRTDANKLLAQRFTREILIAGQTESIGEFFDGDTLLQHNPHMGDGVSEFLSVRAQWAQGGAPARYDTLHKVLGEGNFVLVMSEGQFERKPTAFYDLYRIENGVIAEHWDVLQEIPASEDHKNLNGKF